MAGSGVFAVRVLSRSRQSVAAGPGRGSFGFGPSARPQYDFPSRRHLSQVTDTHHQLGPSGPAAIAAARSEILSDAAGGPRGNGRHVAPGPGGMRARFG